MKTRTLCKRQIRQSLTPSGSQVTFPQELDTSSFFMLQVKRKVNFIVENSWML